jgi:hypothetical protein
MICFYDPGLKVRVGLNLTNKLGFFESHCSIPLSAHSFILSRHHLSQKPIFATQLQAVFSGGQQLGHSSQGLGGVGFSPALQKDSLAKQSQVWSLVSVKLVPGQHAAFGQVQFATSLQPGQMDFGGSPGGNWPFVESNSQREYVGSGLGGLQNPTEAKQLQALFSGGQQLGHSFPGV